MVEKFLVEQYGGISQFSLEDINSTINLSGRGYYQGIGDDLFLVETDEETIKNLAFLKRYSYHIGTVENLAEIRNLSIPDGKFYVRVIDKKDGHGTAYERIAGEYLNGKGRISFENPDFIIHIYHFDLWYIGVHKSQMKPNNPNERRAPMRPYFTPVSMDPKYASFLVNMGYFPKGAKLLDPFCGSSGILIEAALKGYSITGFDIVNEMVVGSRVNLRFFGIKDFDIRRQDFINYEPTEKFDGIITDFPYGRSSKVTKERKTLYELGALKMAQVLGSGSRACIVTDDEQNTEYFKEYFIVDKILKQRIHRSLTRHFVRLIRK
ncbi:methyltransferase domain-containing protein [Cuniculiplasma sp. SKW4]|uniref:methyltransferase domain-containing protein n=1 Tax=Cuniculiplasma sp. SKW4 TaxID=3400171 RepID=UPI003FD03DB6